MNILDKIFSIIKQNNYKIDLNLLNSLYKDKLKFYAFMHFFRLHFYKNVVYGILYLNTDRFIIKLKDNESIRFIIDKSGMRGYYNKNYNKNYNFDYDNEEKIIVGNYSFTAIHLYNQQLNKNEVCFIDSISNKELIIIDNDNIIVNTDLFDFINNDKHDSYEYSSKWIELTQEQIPNILVPSIYKYKILLSLTDWNTVQNAKHIIFL